MLHYVALHYVTYIPTYLHIHIYNPFDTYIHPLSSIHPYIQPSIHPAIHPSIRIYIYIFPYLHVLHIFIYNYILYISLYLYIIMFVTVAAIFVRILLPIGIVSIVMFAVGANIFLHHRFDGKVMVAKSPALSPSLFSASSRS